MPRTKVGNKRSFGSSTCSPNTLSQDTSASATSSPDAEVDKEVAGGHAYEVAQDASGTALSCYLMNSCAKNNNNKYYILQVLRRKGTDSYYLHTRYGRVGATAANALEAMTQEAAAKAYKRTYTQKTGASKGYTPIAMKLGAGDGAMAAKLQKVSADPSVPSQFQKSQLSIKVQELVNFIYDKNLMEQSMADVGYDVKRLPLGELSDETVRAGYTVLR